MTCLPAAAVGRAQQLAATVHGDGDATDVADLLTPLAVPDLYALCVSLAAMVDVEKTPAELLAWNDAAFFHPKPREDRSAAGGYVIAVADHYGLTVGDLLGRSRQYPVVRARHVAMWFCVQRAHLTLMDAGRMFARDHTTVLHGVRKVEGLIGQGWTPPSLLRVAS